MFSICIPSTSINKVQKNLLYINKQILKSSITKDIEKHKRTSNASEIFKVLDLDFKTIFKFLSKTTFKELHFCC